MILPDVSFRGKIDEKDLKDDTCTKVEDSRGEYSEVVVDRVVKENGNEEHYCKRTMMTLITWEMARRKRTIKMAVAWKMMHSKQ